MSDHAKLSPSARHRWALCPGSVREEAKYPEPPSGPAAIDGTHSHTLLEHCIKTNLADPHIFVGQTLKDHDGEFKVDNDRAGRVAVAMDYIRSRVREYPGGCEVLSEDKVNPEWLTGRSDLYGTVDCQIWGGDLLEIIDYKDGMGVVEAQDNPQLEQYALGVLSRFKLQPGEAFPFTRIRMTIIQPKLAYKGMKAINSHEISVLDLLAKIPTIVGQAVATDDPNAPLVPGDRQCKFCKAKGACPALAGKVSQEVGLMFQPIEQLDMAQQAANKNPEQMTDEQIRQVLEAAPLVRQFLEGVEAEAKRRLEAGIPVPGFKLVRGRGSRQWALPEEEMVAKLTKFGVPKKEVYETKLLSPAKVEKLVWTKKAKDGTEEKGQLSAKQIEKMNQEYVTTTSGSITIAPESDPREAIVTNAAPLFQAIPAATTPEVPAFLAPPSPALPAWMM